MVKQECAKYPNAEIIWAQEEHKNQGSWTYIQPRFITALSNSRDVWYVHILFNKQCKNGIPELIIFFSKNI